MGKQPLTRKKSLQQRLVFAEKNSPPKKDGKPSQETNKSYKGKESDDEDTESKIHSPDKNLFQISPVSESVANFCTYPDTSSSLSSCCDNKVVVCKTKSASKSSLTHNDGIQSTCSCSSSFTCPSHINSSVEKPSSVNPFPTKRRVGSMKTRATGKHNYRQ